MDNVTAEVRRPRYRLCCHDRHSPFSGIIWYTSQHPAAPAKVDWAGDGHLTPAGQSHPLSADLKLKESHRVWQLCGVRVPGGQCSDRCSTGYLFKSPKLLRSRGSCTFSDSVDAPKFFPKFSFCLKSPHITSTFFTPKSWPGTQGKGNVTTQGRVEGWLTLQGWLLTLSLLEDSRIQDVWSQPSS